MGVQEIKIYLKKNRITYDKLAEISGIPIGTIKSIFSGRTVSPRIDTITAIEKALGISDGTPLAARYSFEEHELILKYRKLPDKLKKLVRDQIDAFSTNND